MKSQESLNVKTGTKGQMTHGGQLRSACFAGILLLVFFHMAVSTVVAQPTGLRVVTAARKTTQISQYGITWYFDRPVEFGQFVNGDYWVLGPVSIIAIDPPSLDEDGRIKHGAMLNPSFGDTQGFDSHTRANSYSAENNVGRPGGQRLSADNPLQIHQTASLVSVISHPEPNTRPSYTDAAVLTVVETVPPEDAFRPSYSGEIKYWHTVSDINWALLESRQVSRAVVSELPDLEELSNQISRVWLDFRGGSWTGRKIHPSNNMPDYGRDMAHITGTVALVLLLDYPRTIMETLLVRFLQIGLDWWGTVQAQGGTANIYPADGGHGMGRKWPIIFAGLMFDDPEILKFADASQYFIFQEDQQTAYVDQNLIDCSQEGTSGCWSPDTRNTDYMAYTEDWIGLPEWGIRYSSDFSRNDASWTAVYRSINTVTAAHVLAATIMGVRELWNWDPVFDYYDRLYASRHGEPVVDPAGAHGLWQVGVNGLPALAYDMWGQYRAQYGSVWSYE